MIGQGGTRFEDGEIFPRPTVFEHGQVPPPDTEIQRLREIQFGVPTGTLNQVSNRDRQDCCLAA